VTPPGTLPATYADAVAALQARGRFGIRLGLGRTRALLRELGSPEAGIRGALIGGTNGKGSVVALVSSCLAAAGHRAGDTPKPHLVTYRERLRIGQHPIATPAVQAVAHRRIAFHRRVHRSPWARAIMPRRISRVPPRSEKVGAICAT